MERQNYLCIPYSVNAKSEDKMQINLGKIWYTLWLSVEINISESKNDGGQEGQKCVCVSHIVPFHSRVVNSEYSPPTLHFYKTFTFSIPDSFITDPKYLNFKIFPRAGSHPYWIHIPILPTFLTLSTSSEHPIITLRSFSNSPKNSRPTIN